MRIAIKLRTSIVTAAVVIFAIASACASAETVFPGAKWAQASPQSQGVDAAKLTAAIDYLKANSGPDGVRELVIIRNGRMIHHGDNIDNVHGVWSLTKSFTSTALGLLIDDGKATLDTRACEVLPAMRKNYSGVKLRHFTTMTSGYRAVGDEPRGSYVHGPSLTPFQPSDERLFAPGEKYAYWDSAMNQFANVLTRIAGQPLEELFKSRIADPIGMDRKYWRWGDFGQVDGIRVNGGSGNSGGHMFISARQLARFGHLLLNRGKWDGKQLLSAEWIEKASRPQVPATVELGHESSADGRGVYGFNFWTNGVKADGKRKWPDVPKSTYSASGYNNNDMFVISEWNMVIVRLGLDQNQKSIGDKTYNSFLAKISRSIDADTL